MFCCASSEIFLYRIVEKYEKTAHINWNFRKKKGEFHSLCFPESLGKMEIILQMEMPFPVEF